MLMFSCTYFWTGYLIIWKWSNNNKKICQIEGDSVHVVLSLILYVSASANYGCQQELLTSLYVAIL